MKAISLRPLLFLVLAFAVIVVPSDGATKKKKPKNTEPPAEEKAVVPLPPAELTVGVQFQDDEAEGMGDILIPAWRFPSGLLFVNPRATRTDHSAEEYNVGLGYRHLFPKRQVILGVNGYYDYRDTGHSTYDQWGAGLELLSQWLDARANVYKPEDKRTTVATDTEQSSSRSTSTAQGWTDPYAEDHEIAQSYIIQQTTRTTTTTRYFEQYEKALEGYDAEIGLRLPLPVRPETFETRVFGGYYRFDAEYGDDIDGFKARLELRLLASLFLDAAWYENKDLTGSDYSIGGRFSVPLDLAALAHGRNPFAEFKSRLGRKERSFDARLTEMVMRDPQIRLEISDFIEREDLYRVETSKDTDTWRQDYMLMVDVNFIDGDAGSASGDGSAEQPFSAIQNGVDDAFGERNVYVYDSSKSYRENVEMTPGVTLWGSGCLVPGYNGKSFGSGIQPTVDGRSQGPAITMADRTTVRGFRITNTDHGGGPKIENLGVLGDTDVSRVGLLGRNATDLLVGCNTIEGAREGAIFGQQGDFSLTFIHNDVLNNMDAGVLIGAEGASGVFNVLVDNSLFEANGIGLMSQAMNYDSALLQIQNSAFNRNGADGASILMADNGAATVAISGSWAERNAGTGFNVIMTGTDSALAELFDVDAHRNGGPGVSVTMVDVGTGSAFLNGVRADRNTGPGINVTIVDADEALASLSHVSANRNIGPGVNVTLVSSDEATAYLNHTHANNNEGPGLNVVLVDAGFALASVANSSAHNNLGGGVNLVLTDSPWSTALISGSQANNNLGGPGFNVDINGGAIALANLSGLTANNNQGEGIRMNLQGDMAAVGLVGLPGALAQTLNSALGLAGFGLPPEAENLLGPAGPVQVLGNQGLGIVASIEGDMLAGGAFFDINAQNNFGGGVAVDIASPDGIALGLAGSSENFMEVAQLGADIAGLFGFDIPVTPAPGGRMTINNNIGPGFLMSVGGDLAAIGAVVGLEANGNLGVGAVVATVSEGISVSAAARIEVLNTVGDGLVVSANGPTAAIGVIADARATNNAGSGIIADVNSDMGYAGVLMASTDPLRPVAGLLGEMFLGAPFVLPGAPFGPVVASDNGEDGIVANITGRDGAVGLFLDTQATGNASNGMNVSVTSPEGFAVSAFLSTDLLFDLLSGFLGPIDYDPLGGIIASDNGNHGIRERIDGRDGAYSLIAGLTANGNGNDGLNARLDSAQGAADGFVAAADAFGNGGQGLFMDLDGRMESLAVFVEIDAGGNAQQGIRAVGTSSLANAYAVLSGVETASNGMAGVSVDLGAAVDAIACVTDLDSHDNTGRGLSVQLAAGGTAALLGGPTAIDVFSGGYTPIFGLLDLLSGLFPEGPITLNDNGLAGLYVDITAVNGGLVDLTSVTANNNSNAGLNVSINVANGPLVATFTNVTANDNGMRGLNFEALGGGLTTDLRFDRVTTIDNDGDGIRLVANRAGLINLFGERIVSQDNGGAGVRVDMTAGGLLTMDFGGGLLGSLGQGSIFGNGARDFRNIGAGTVFAEQNWWGAAPPLANQFFGAVDRTPWLTAPPP